jgi:Protein of unknown function (DUF3124)
MRPIAIAPALALLVAIASCDGTGPGPSRVKGDLKRPGLSEVGPVDEGRVVAGQTIYVPAYSYVSTADNAEPLNVAITLFFRNSDPEVPVVVTKVSYHDSGGRLVRELLKSPIKVDPLASADFFVKESDLSGGSSPSFLIEWISEKAAADPVAESVMIGTAGTQGISFVCSGRVIRSRRPGTVVGASPSRPPSRAGD